MERAGGPGCHGAGSEEIHGSDLRVESCAERKRDAPHGSAVRTDDREIGQLRAQVQRKEGRSPPRFVLGVSFPLGVRLAMRRSKGLLLVTRFGWIVFSGLMVSFETNVRHEVFAVDLLDFFGSAIEIERDEFKLDVSIRSHSG